MATRCCWASRRSRSTHIFTRAWATSRWDLQPVSLTHQMANVLVVNPATPLQRRGGVDYGCQARPGALSYASAGSGNTHAYRRRAVQGAKWRGHRAHPLQGGPPALNDVLGGQVPMMFNNLPAIVGWSAQANCARWRWATPAAPSSYRKCRPWKAGLKGLQFDRLEWRAGARRHATRDRAIPVTTGRCPLESPTLAQTAGGSGLRRTLLDARTFAALIRSEHEWRPW